MKELQKNSAGGDTFSWGINKMGRNVFSSPIIIAIQTYCS